MIIVADDDRHHSSLIVISLTGHRRDIQLFDHGDAALGAIDALPRLDLLICSATLPRVDGLALTRHVRGHPVHRKAPVIVTSLDADPEVERSCLQAGADCCFGSPLDLTRLRYEAELLMQKRRAGSVERETP